MKGLLLINKEQSRRFSCFKSLGDLLGFVHLFILPLVCTLIVANYIESIVQNVITYRDI